jgi:hypothetical protein
MTFGKHLGKLVSEVPTSYLRWCFRECRDIDLWLRSAIARELDRRGPEGSCPSNNGPPPGRSVVDVATVLRKVHHEMTLRFHPDRTLDDGRAMAAVNVTMDRLRELLGVA